MIVLDSNQLRLVLPGSPALKLLSMVSKQVGHTLATTDVVIREVVRQRHDALTAALRARIKADCEFDRLVRPQSRSLNPLPVGWLSKSGFIAYEIREFESGLHETFRVLETAPEDALEALRMEADHRAPCSSGTGGRDAAIWLTAVRACGTPEIDRSGRPMPVIFVSEDKGFATIGDPSASLPKLHSETINGEMLILTPTVLDALAAFGYPRQVVDAKNAFNRMRIRKGLSEGIMRALNQGDLESLGAIHEIDGSWLTSRGNAVQCCGDGMTLTCAAGYWRIATIGKPSGYRPDELWRYRFDIKGIALIVEDNEEDVLEVEFVSSERGPIRRTYERVPEERDNS